MKTAILYARVSTRDQHPENQQLECLRFCQDQGIDIIKTYSEHESAWRGNRQGELEKLNKAVIKGSLKADYLVVWSIDRLTRKGPAEAFAAVSTYEKAGIQVLSLREPWINNNGLQRSLMLAISSWFAEYESTHKSERIRAGLERRKLEGLPVGRQPGAKDKPGTIRRRAGYVARQDRERLARAAK